MPRKPYSGPKFNDPEWRQWRAQRAGKASTDPLNLARRVVRCWPQLDKTKQEAIRNILAPILARVEPAQNREAMQ